MVFPLTPKVDSPNAARGWWWAASRIVCPWHRYQISLRTGEGTYLNLQGNACSKGVKQRVDEVRRSGDQIELKLSHDPADASSATLWLYRQSTSVMKRRAWSRR